MFRGRTFDGNLNHIKDSARVHHEDLRPGSIALIAYTANFFGSADKDKEEQTQGKGKEKAKEDTKIHPDCLPPFLGLNVHWVALLAEGGGASPTKES